MIDGDIQIQSADLLAKAIEFLFCPARSLSTW